MPPATADRHEASGGRRLAAPVAVGLALFLGGGRFVSVLSSALSTDAGAYGARSIAVSMVIRYGGALVVVLCCSALVRRLGSRPVAEQGARVDRPAAGRRRRSPALAVVVAGLLLMAASEVPALLYRLADTGNTVYLLEGTLGTVSLAVASAAALLGPVLAAAGTYLALRRLEEATTREPTDESTESTPEVTDLDG